MYTGTTLHILQSVQQEEQDKLFETRGNGYKRYFGLRDPMPGHTPPHPHPHCP
jgi:hypothetical protein